MSARRTLVIVNPAAGGGRAAAVGARLAEMVGGDDAGDLRWTEAPGHASELALEAVAEGRARVVAVGGDGTLQEVVNGLLASDGPRPILGIVPSGRGNDLARSLGLPRRRLDAWRLASAGPAEPLDALHAASDAGRRRWFVAAGGAGFDAQVARVMAGRRGWQRSQLGYLLVTLAELGRFENRVMRVAIDDRPPIQRRGMVVALANGEYYGGGMRIAPGAAVSDGLVDVCIIGDLSRGEAIRWIPRLYRGTHLANRKVELLRGRRVRIEADEATSVHLDGEPFDDLPLTITISPGALRVAGAPEAGVPGTNQYAPSP